MKYELYLRQGLVEYLQGSYDAASKAFDTAGPEQPTTELANSSDTAHIGLHFLIDDARKMGGDNGFAGIQRHGNRSARTAVNLGNIYLEGIRPDKADEVFTRILTGDPVLGKVSNALKGYAILQLGVAIDREGRRQEALTWFKQLAYSPQFAGTFWQPYGLFRLAVFTHNLTQDEKQSMPLCAKCSADIPTIPRPRTQCFSTCTTQCR